VKVSEEYLKDLLANGRTNGNGINGRLFTKQKQPPEGSVRFFTGLQPPFEILATGKQQEGCLQTNGGLTERFETFALLFL
jgi:hypothetical protein